MVCGRAQMEDAERYLRSLGIPKGLSGHASLDVRYSKERRGDVVISGATSQFSRGYADCAHTHDTHDPCVPTLESSLVIIRA
jgi:hypothetical protein